MTEAATGSEIREQRLANMHRLKELGYPPYGPAYPRTGRLSEVRAAFAEGTSVRIAGRLVAKREMGKSIFAHLDDGSDRFQVYAKKNELGERDFAAFQLLDLGDVIGAEGMLFTTKTGEQTLKIARWTMLAKALLPLPEKWHGLQDLETRYRQRYLDLIANPDIREVFRTRSEAIRAIRAFLTDRGFMEVETPMIQAQAGGAAATPFRTRYEALGVDMFLRIAPELYLKRLLVGGMDKIFELNRNFRNEGLSRNHNPEFTMLEIYEAYTDVRGMMELAQELVTHVARAVAGGLVLDKGSRKIDLTPPWRELPYRELICETAGADWFERSEADQRERAQALGVQVEPDWSSTDITQEIFEKCIERNLVDPTFVTRLPAPLVPLAKTCADDETVADVFELVIDGREIAPAYSELNDALEQRHRFEAQAGERREKIDTDFLTALDHGMPPAGGMGIGIDRLMMVLTGKDAIRDVILFPQLKPRG